MPHKVSEVPIQSYCYSYKLKTKVVSNFFVFLFLLMKTTINLRMSHTVKNENFSPAIKADIYFEELIKELVRCWIFTLTT